VKSAKWEGLIDMGLKIGEIAKRSGVPISTIRFYVKEGLLPSRRRSTRRWPIRRELHQ